MTANDWLTLAFGELVTMALLAIPYLLGKWMDKNIEQEQKDDAKTRSVDND